MDKNIISKSEFISWGKELLRAISGPAEIVSFREQLLGYSISRDYEHDTYAWLTCILALKASASGTYGVGAILINKAGDIESWGHNQVFSPQFHSDRHAEMVVVSSFEDATLGKADPASYTIISSLEPCPMCLSRLIISRIGTILYVATDETGGMVHKIDGLPSLWLDLISKRKVGQTRCSTKLTGIASSIFMLNSESLDSRLR